MTASKKYLHLKKVCFYSKSILLVFVLLCPLFLFYGCSEEKGSTFEKVRRKILLFGIDGATWDVIDPLLEEGKLPNFKKLIENGTRANLKTIKPTHSPRIWNTIITGVSPEEHGIESFIVNIPGTEETGPPSSNMRKVKALWNIFSEFDYSVGIVGWWASFPAEKVNGFIISDHANYIRKSISKGIQNLSEKGMSQKEEREVYPPELYEEIASFVQMPADVDRNLLSRFADLPEDKWTDFQSQQSFSRDNNLSVLKFSLLIDESFIASGLYALKKHKPDFMAFYLNGVDALEHQFWKYMEPGKYKIAVPNEDVRLYKNLIKDYYVYLDEVLGRFLPFYPREGSTIMIISDHGHEANPLHGTGGKEIEYDRFASGYHGRAPDGVLSNLWKGY